ncbi:MAG: hypothetical protein ACJ74Z_11825 [Bryobacteraceae bacterium]
MATLSHLKEPPDFSLVLGGPLYQLLRRAHLGASALEQVNRSIIVAALITWLPLAALSLIQGAPAGAKLTFLHDIETQVRFLIALPVLIAAELIVHQRMRNTVKRFVERGIVRSHDVPKFNSAIEAAIRLRNSLPVEIGLVILTYTVGRWVWRSNVALETATWYAVPDGSHFRLTLPGYWYAWISLPLFQLVLVRWYLRFLNWFQFLWRVSRLDLHLLPAHPDRSGGLGFLGTGSYAFAPILFAQGTLLAAFLANRIFYQGQSLLSFKPVIFMFVVFFLVVILAPLFVFTPHIAAAKRRGLGVYGTLASSYVAGFEEKWLAGGGQQSNSRGEELLGSADIQSLADLGNSFGFVREMRPVPFSLQDVTRLAAATAAPVLPLLLTIMPFEELISRLFKVVF